MKSLLVVVAPTTFAVLLLFLFVVVPLGNAAGVKGSRHRRQLQEEKRQPVALQNGAGKFKMEIEGSPVASRNVESITVEDLVIDEREMTSGTHHPFIWVGCVCGSR